LKRFCRPDTDRMLKYLRVQRLLRGDIKKQEVFSNLKYRLINASSHATFRDIMVSGRKRLFAHDIWAMHTENYHCDNLAENLYAALYSKFYTQCYILRGCNLIRNEDPSKPDPDSEIKDKFRAMLEKTPYSDSTAFDKAYLDIIKEFFPAEILHFQHLNNALSKARIEGFEGTDAAGIEQLFVDGTTLTAGFLVRKLGEDAYRFKSLRDRAIETGTQWRFLLAYLSAGIGFTLYYYKTFYGSRPQEVVIMNDGMRVEMINKEPLKVEVCTSSPSLPCRSVIEFPPELRVMLTGSSIGGSVM